MDYSVFEKLRIEFLPSLFQALLITSFHALGHFVAGDPSVFEQAGVREAGLSVLVISFSVILYYNVIGWKLNEKIVKAVKGAF